MWEAHLEFRWTTVLNVDVVGYSALMAHDELGTSLALLRNWRWISRSVRDHGGEVMDAPGDNLLAEFPDETKALQCALELQRRAGARNRNIPRHLHLQLRAAVHSGPVLRGPGLHFGTTLNVSARLQSMARPGGVVVSRSSAARADQGLLNGLDFSEELYCLRNIPEPVAALSLSGAL